MPHTPLPPRDQPKLPYIQLYPGDWLLDEVSGCSMAAQGLWLRMMFLMHRAEEYGYLAQNGKPIPDEQVARRCGCALDEYLELLGELKEAGVPAEAEDGTIFSRRMVRDAQERASNAERQRRWRERNGDVTPPVTPPSQPGHGERNADVTPESHAMAIATSHADSSSSSEGSSSSNGKGQIACLPAAAAPDYGAWLREPHVSGHDPSLIVDYVIATKAHSHNPQGLARKLHRTGEEDGQIREWEQQQAAKAKEPERQEADPEEIIQYADWLLADLVKETREPQAWERQIIDLADGLREKVRAG